MRFELRERGRDIRAGFMLACALVVYLTATQFVLPAYDRIVSRVEAVGAREAELRKLRRALSGEGRYVEVLNRVQNSVAEAEAKLVRGDNPALASVELQTIVEAAAQNTNIQIGQRSISPAKKKDEHFNEITMTLSFESTPGQLVSFLEGLRSAPKFVAVQSLQAAPLQLTDDATARLRLKTIKVTATVSALLSKTPVPRKG